MLQNPTFPEKEVELEKATQIAAIKAEDEQITAVARNVMREKLFGAHPYALRGSGRAESVERITPADLLAFQKEYVVAKNGVIAVFGDVKAEEVLRLGRKEFWCDAGRQTGIVRAAAARRRRARPSVPLKSVTSSKPW